MSPTPSRRASSTTRSAISPAARLLAFAALVAVACTPKLQPPTAKIAAVSAAHVGVPVMLDGSGSQPGKPPEGENPLPVSFKWTFLEVPAGSKAALNDGTLAKPSFVPDVAGSYKVQLVVADGVFASSPETAEIAATADCQPTVSKVTAAPAQPAVGEAVALTFDAGNPCDAAGTEGRIVAWKWTVVSAPAGSQAEIAHPSSPAASFVPDRRGDYELALEVTDALGLKSDAADANAHVKVTAQACGDNAPEVQEISSAPEKPNVQQLVQLAATVRDADTLSPCTLHRTISFEWSLNALPAGSKAQLNDRHATNPSFTPDIAGDYVLALVATDELGRPSPQRTFTVSTTECGAAVPVAEAVAPSSAFAGQGIQLGVKVTDADNAAGDGLNSPGAAADPNATGCSVALSYAYHWKLLAAPKGSKAALNDPALANPSLVTDVAGDYLLSVTATASTGKTSVPALATISVSDCGSLKPVVALELPPGAITGAPVRLAAQVTDPNASCRPSPSFSYSWSLVSAPAGSIAALSGTTPAGRSVEQTPSFVPDLPGSYTVGLVVVDSAGLASDAVFATIDVSACNAPLGVKIDAPAGAITGSAVRLTAAVTDPNAPPSAPSPAPAPSPIEVDAGTPDDADAGTPADVDAGEGDVDAGAPADVDAGSGPAPAPAATCSAEVLPYAYQWTLVGLPTGSHAALNNPNASAPSFVADLPGTYTVQLVVTDAAGNRSPAVTEEVEVAHCTAPIDAEIQAISGAAVGLPLSLSATVADPNEPASTNGCSIATAPYSYVWSVVGLPAGSRVRLNNASSVSPSFTPDVQGDYTLALQVSDAAGNRSPVVTSTVTVSATCRAPLTATINATPGPAGLPIVLGAGVTDPNAPSTATGCTAPTAPYSYMWSIVGLPAGSLAQLNNAQSSAPTFVPDVDGSYTIALQVTDAAGNRSPVVTSDLVTTGRCNAPLSLAFTSVTGAAAGLPVGLAVTVTDPNTPSATNGCSALTAPYSYAWSLVGLPTGSKATLNNPQSAGPSFIPDLTGTYSVALVVTDAAGNRSPLGSTDITVSGSCTAPLTATIVAPASSSTAMPFQLTALVTDPNTPASTNDCTAATAPYAYAWSLTGLPLGSKASLSNVHASAPTLNPDAVGSYTVTLDVVDAAGNRSPLVSKDIVVTGSCNGAPTASISAVSSSAGLPVKLSAVVTDPNTPSSTNACAAPTAPYAYRWSLVGLPTGSRATLNNAGASSPSFTPDLAGTYSVALVVTDALGLASPTVSADVVISTTCAAPLSVTVNAPAGSAAGVPVALAATVVDPNAANTACSSATPYSYSWSLIGLPTGSAAKLNSTTVANPSFTPDLPNTASGTATYTAVLTVTDALGNKGISQPANIVVSNSCNAPLGAVISAPSGANTLVPVQLTATVSNPNDPATNLKCVAATNPVSYAWQLVGLPAGSSAKLNNPSAAAPSFIPDRPGTYSVILQVTDAAGNRSPWTLPKDVVVANCTAPLTVSITRSGTASTLQTLSFAAVVADPNTGCGTATPFTYAWSVVGPSGSGATLSPSAGTATLVPDVAGTYAVSVKVTDALGNSGSATNGPVAVTSCGSSFPIAIRASATSIETGATVDLSLPVSDPNATSCGQPTAAPFSYAWTLVPPSGSAATLSNAQGAKPRFTPDVAGTYALAVTTTDALGYQASTTLNIVAYACPVTVTISQSPANPVTTFSQVKLTAAASTPASCLSAPPLSYEWQFDAMPTASSAQFTSRNMPSAVFTADTQGSWVARVNVTDNLSGQTYTQTATVTTTTCGTVAPTAKIAVTGSVPSGVTAPANNYATPSGSPAIGVSTTTSVQLDGTQSLAPNISGGCLPGPLTFQWTLYAVPPGSSAAIKLDNAGKPSLSFDVTGEYVVQLVVNDGVLGSTPTYLRFSK